MLQICRNSIPLSVLTHYIPLQSKSNTWKLRVTSYSFLQNIDPISRWNALALLVFVYRRDQRMPLMHPYAQPHEPARDCNRHRHHRCDLVGILRDQTPLRAEIESRDDGCSDAEIHKRAISYRRGHRRSLSWCLCSPMTLSSLEAHLKEAFRTAKALQAQTERSLGS